MFRTCWIILQTVLGVLSLAFYIYEEDDETDTNYVKGFGLLRHDGKVEALKILLDLWNFSKLEMRMRNENEKWEKKIKTRKTSLK